MSMLNKDLLEDENKDYGTPGMGSFKENEDKPMFIKPGNVWIESKKDPRWNWSGRVDVLLFTAGVPLEVTKAIEEKKKELGHPPDDLTWGGMKD